MTKAKKSLKILTIIGARPQFIKAAMVSNAISGYNTAAASHRSQILDTIIHTGQHYDSCMSDRFFKELSIPSPHYHLGIGNSSHGVMTGKMLEKIEPILLEEKPDLVLVYGDTNSTLAGALAAAKLKIPVGHVEAGMRSYNRSMPEEINRVMTDHIANLLFCSTKVSFQNLDKEGITQNVYQVGDVMYDAHLYYDVLAEAKSDIINNLDVKPKAYLLATIHRAENTDNPDRLISMFKGLLRIADEMPIVIPLHPRTREALDRHGLLKKVGQKLTIIDPVGYFDMLRLEKNARLIATDSGGVQKEAFFYKIPCLTLRDETEWTELVSMGCNRLVGTNENNLLAEFRTLLSMGTFPWEQKHLYGGGQSAMKILTHILSFFRIDKNPTNSVDFHQDTKSVRCYEPTPSY